MPVWEQTKEFKHLYESENKKEQHERDQNLAKVLEEVNQLRNGEDKADDHIDIAWLLWTNFENNLQAIWEDNANKIITELQDILNNDSNLIGSNEKERKEIIQEINHLINLLHPAATTIKWNDNDIDTQIELDEYIELWLNNHKEKIKNICKGIDTLLDTIHDNASYNKLKSNLIQIKTRIDNKNRISNRDCYIIIDFLERAWITSDQNGISVDKLVTMLETFINELTEYNTKMENHNETIEHYKKQYEDWQEDYNEFKKIIDDENIRKLANRLNETELGKLKNYISHKFVNETDIIYIYDKMHKMENALDSQDKHLSEKDKRIFNEIFETINDNYKNEITTHRIDLIETTIKRRDQDLIQYYWDNNSDRDGQEITTENIIKMFPNMDLWKEENTQLLNELTNRFIERNEERISNNIISLKNLDITTTDFLKQNERNNFSINAKGTIKVKDDVTNFSFTTITNRVKEYILKSNKTKFNFINENEVNTFFNNYISDTSDTELKLRDPQKEISNERILKLKDFIANKMKDKNNNIDISNHIEPLKEDEILDGNLFWNFKNDKNKAKTTITNFFQDTNNEGVDDNNIWSPNRWWITHVLGRLRIWLTKERKKEDNNEAYIAMKALQTRCNKRNDNNNKITEDWMFGHITFDALTKAIQSYRNQNAITRTSVTQTLTEQQLAQEEINLKRWINEIINSKEFPWKEKITEIIENWTPEDIRYLQLALKPEYKWKIDWKISQNLSDAITNYINNEWEEEQKTQDKIMSLLPEGKGFYNLEEENKDEAFVSVDLTDNDHSYSSEKIAYFADWSEFRYKAIDLQWGWATKKIKYVWRYENKDGNTKTLTLDPTDFVSTENTLSSKYNFTDDEYKRFKKLNEMFLTNYKDTLKISQSNNN